MLVSGYMRFYGLTTHLHLDIDEATHTQTIYSIYKDHHILLKGPPASGDTTLYHGAFYYYLYLPAAIIGQGNPLALAIFTILLSIASVPLLYFGLESSFGKKTALLVAILYGLSYSVILYSRWIWNPNTIPFFFSLAIFSLSQLSKNKKWYLVPFLFALGAISQLHVGSVFIPLLIIPMLPFLLKITKDKKVWVWAIVALIIPWLPTIGEELRHGFPLIMGFKDMLSGTGSKMTTWDHMLKGYNYFVFMFDNVTRLGQYFFIISILAALSLLIYKLKDFRETGKILVPFFLLMSYIYVFATSGYYSGILFIHFAEEIFVLMPIALGIFVGFLLENYATILPGIFIIYLSLSNNWAWYQKDIVFGDEQFGTEKRICQIIQNEGAQNVSIYVNNMANPVYITYVCQDLFRINPGLDASYHFETNFKDTLQYTRDY